MSDVLAGPGQALAAPVRAEMQGRLGGDFSEVRMHTGAAARVSAAEVGARAYTSGSHIVIGTGGTDKDTLAHELVHVIQHRLGRVAGVDRGDGLKVSDPSDQFEREAEAAATRSMPRPAPAGGAPETTGRAPTRQPLVVSRRRVPPPSHSADLLTDEDTFLPGELLGTSAAAANLDAHVRGLFALIQRAWAELSDVEKLDVQAVAGHGLNADAFSKLSAKDQALRWSEAIETKRPDLILGNPRLIDSGFRPGTPDQVNIARLVSNADRILSLILGGSYDDNLSNVFGKANVPEAKAKYRNAQKWLHLLHQTDHILTDRSGYYQETAIAGVSTFQTNIRLKSSKIDNPDDRESIATLIHESMHAGNSDVDDWGYISQASFTRLDEKTKLRNAAHYEVVPRLILNPDDPYAYRGHSFLPTAVTADGPQQELSYPEKVLREVSETFREAWSTALNIHDYFVDAYSRPESWTADQGRGLTYQRALPYWSKVEGLTVHEKTVIDPKGPAAKHPVSQIDVALSEGLARKLFLAIASTPSDVGVLMSNFAMSGLQYGDLVDERRLYSTDVNVQSAEIVKLYVKAILREATRGIPMTGDPDRDARVVMLLARTRGQADMLQPRDPSAFS